MDVFAEGVHEHGRIGNLAGLRLLKAVCRPYENESAKAMRKSLVILVEEAPSSAEPSKYRVAAQPSCQGFLAACIFRTTPGGPVPALNDDLRYQNLCLAIADLQSCHSG